MGAAVVDGEEEVEDEDEVGVDSTDFADFTTLAAAPAAPMNSFRGFEVVLAAAMLTRNWCDVESKEVVVTLM